MQVDVDPSQVLRKNERQMVCLLLHTISLKGFGRESEFEKSDSMRIDDEMTMFLTIPGLHLGYDSM